MLRSNLILAARLFEHRLRTFTVLCLIAAGKQEKPAHLYGSVSFANSSIGTVIQALNKKNVARIMLQPLHGEEKDLPLITLKLNNVPLQEILKYLCLLTGLEFRIGNGAIIVGSDLADMDMRFFPVSSALGSSFPSGKSETASTEALRRLSLGRRVEFPDNTAIKQYFSDRGVSFSPGRAAIAHDPSTGHLVVINTEENLRKLKALLKELDR